MTIPGRNRRKVTRVRLHDPASVSINFLDSKQNVYEGQLWDYARYGFGIKLIDNLIHKRLDNIFNITISAFGSKKFVGNGKIMRITREEGFLLLGIYLENDPFQCHPYFINNGTESILIDPGSMLQQEDIIKKIQMAGL